MVVSTQSGYWDLNLGPLEEPKVFLITEATLQPQMLISKHLLLHFFFFASFQVREREQNTLKAEPILRFLVDTPRVTRVGVGPGSDLL